MTNLDKISAFNEFIAREPNAMDRVVRGITRGYTIREIAKVFKIDSAELSIWITSDDARNRRYSEALAHCQRAMREIVVEKFREAVDFDIGDLWKDGKIKDPSQWPEAARRLVQKVEVTEDGIKVHMPDRLRAAESLGKILGMFVDRVEKNERITYVVEVPPVAPSIEAWAKDVTPDVKKNENQDKLPG